MGAHSQMRRLAKVLSGPCTRQITRKRLHIPDIVHSQNARVQTAYPGSERTQINNKPGYE